MKEIHMCAQSTNTFTTTVCQRMLTNWHGAGGTQWGYGQGVNYTTLNPDRVTCLKCLSIMHQPKEDNTDEVQTVDNRSEAG